MRAPLLFWFPALAAVATASQFAVDRTPPGIFESSLLPFLSDETTVLEGHDHFRDDTESGVSLLDEMIYYVDGEGVEYRLYHDVLWARDEAGADILSKRVFTYDRERESLWLVQAEVIQPDGSRRPLEGRAAFVQTPQYEAENNLYTSEAELSLLFPDVRPGSIVRSTILVRVDEPVFPGEFMLRYGFGSSWPTFRERLVVKLPSALHARVHSLESRTGVPPVQEKPTHDGWIVSTWEAELREGAAWEVNAPRFQFRMPTLWLSSLPDWDAVAGWYQGLLEGRADLGAGLAATVDGWTEGVSDPAEVLRILTERVANDVRYTGLEFGLAGFQPYPCKTVWANRYGDCKDKANLLSAMLRHKGIEAHLGLLNTRYHGRIEKRSPSWQQFNHAIVVAELTPGEFVFCDPTIEQLPAGLIGMGDAARDVLVVREGKALWLRTPEALTGAIRVRFDAEMKPDGEMSGWFEFGGEGADGAYYGSHFRDFDRHGRLREAQSYLRTFLAGAEAIDEASSSNPALPGHFAIRSYFIRPGAPATNHSLSFPYPDNWLPALDTDTDRRWDYNMDLREESVEAVVRLPEGWIPDSLPDPFSAQTEKFFFDASWEHADGAVVARLRYAPRTHLLDPGEYASFHQAVRALSSWLDRPVNLVRGETTAPGAAPPPPLDDFPILSSAEAQLRLVDERYPEEGDRERRRQALESVLQWFPGDADGILTTKVKLVLLDWTDDTHGAVAEQLAEALTLHGAGADRLTVAWARYLEARCRWWAEEDPQAIEALVELAADPALNPFRRAWSAYYAGLFLFASDEPERAFALLREADDEIAEARPSIVNLQALEQARRAPSNALRAWIDDAVEEFGADADELLAAALTHTFEQRGELPPDKVDAALEAWIEAAARVPEEAFPALREQAAPLSRFLEEKAARARIVAAAESVLTPSSPAWWSPAQRGEYGEPEAVIQALETFEDEDEYLPMVDAFLQLAKYHEPDYDTFGRYLRWTLWYLERRGLEPALFEALSEPVLGLPTDGTDEILGSWLVLARHHRESDRSEAAARLYERVMKHEDALPYQRVDAAGHLAHLLLAEENIDAALEALEMAETHHLSNRFGADKLLLQLFLRLERGEFTRGLELVSLIAGVNEEYIPECVYSVQLAALRRFADTPEALLAHWERQRRWLPSWRALLAAYGVDALPVHTPAVSENIEEDIEKIGGATEAGEAAGMLQALRWLVANARWIPAFAVDLGQQIHSLGNVEPTLQARLWEYYLDLANDWVPIEEPVDQSVDLYVAIALDALGRTGEAVSRVRELFDRAGVLDDQGSAALRLWILYAEKDPDLADEPRVVAEEHLATSPEIAARGEVVAILSDAFWRAGEFERHRDLLERELEDARNEWTDQQRTALEARLNQLRAHVETGSQFIAAVEQWVEDNGLEWIRQIPVDSLEDPRFSGVSGYATTENAKVTEAEILKFNYLLATDPGTPSRTRLQAFVQMFAVMTGAFSDAEAYSRSIETLARVEVVDRGVRQQLADAAVELLASLEQPEKARNLCKDDAFSALFTEEQRSRHEVILQASEDLRAARPADLERAMEKLLPLPVSFVTSALYPRILVQLIYLGEAERADALFERTREISLEPQLAASTSASNLRLEWLRTMRRAKAAVPFYARLRDAILAVEEAPGEAPAMIGNFYDFHRSFWGSSDAEMFQGRLYMIATGRFFENSWNEVFSGIGMQGLFHTRHRMLGRDVLEYALTAPVDDQTRAEWIWVAIHFCDSDHPPMREAATALMRRFLEQASSPQDDLAATAASFYLLATTVRHSLESEPGDLFDAEFTAWVDRPMLDLFRIAFSLNRERPGLARRFLDAMDPGALSNPFFFPHYDRALAMLGREDERSLLAEAMEDTVRRERPDLWLHPFPEQASMLLQVLQRLEQPEGFPRPLFDHLMETHGEGASGFLLRLAYAQLNEDWQSALEAAEDVLAINPEFYEARYDRALAHHHLGNRDEALRDLDIFLRWCRDSARYRDARSLHEALSAAPQAAALAD